MNGSGAVPAVLADQLDRRRGEVPEIDDDPARVLLTDLVPAGNVIRPVQSIGIRA